MSKLKYEVIGFKVKEDFINNQARQLLIEGEIGKAIDFLKTITDDEDIIADVLFGRKKFVEIGDTQEFTLKEDDAKHVCGLGLKPDEVMSNFERRSKELIELAEHFGMTPPKMKGQLYKNRELNRVSVAKRNFDLLDRMKDEIIYPEIFIEYDLVSNPMVTTKLFTKRYGGSSSMTFSRKYQKKYCPKARDIEGIYSLVSFFETLTNNFSFPTKMDFQTYDPEEFVRRYRDGELSEQEIKEAKVRQDIEEATEREIKHLSDDILDNPVMENLKKLNPKMAEITEESMKRMIDGGKTYSISLADDIHGDSGYIDKEGKWYTVCPMEHERFADEWLYEHKITQSERSAKDTLVKKLGWIAVTVGAFGVYVHGGRYNNKQRQVLKKWMDKFKITNFDPVGDPDGFNTVKSIESSWFNGGRL